MTDSIGWRRRTVLASLGGGLAVSLAGCSDDDGVGADPSYERAEVDDLEGDDRDAEEMAAAEQLAEQESREGVTALEPLALAEHEFVLEDDYRGPTVQGVVENEGDDRLEVVEVRVRVYDDDDVQLGQYLDSTGDLEGAGSWEFQVVLLEPPTDIAAYEIAVAGTPA